MTLGKKMSTKSVFFTIFSTGGNRLSTKVRSTKLKIIKIEIKITGLRLAEFDALKKKKVLSGSTLNMYRMHNFTRVIPKKHDTDCDITV